MEQLFLMLCAAYWLMYFIVINAMSKIYFSFVFCLYISKVVLLNPFGYLICFFGLVPDCLFTILVLVCLFPPLVLDITLSITL